MQLEYWKNVMPILSVCGSWGRKLSHAIDTNVNVLYCTALHTVLSIFSDPIRILALCSDYIIVTVQYCISLLYCALPVLHALLFLEHVIPGPNEGDDTGSKANLLGSLSPTGLRTKALP